MPPTLLYRLAAGIGFFSAAIIAISSARRGGLLPENGFTHAIAPLGVLAGLFALTGLYLWQRVESGRLGLIGYALNAVGLAGAFGIEYTWLSLALYRGATRGSGTPTLRARAAIA